MLVAVVLKVLVLVLPELVAPVLVAECDEYIRIFEYSNIFDPNIYSCICSYHFWDTNIFGYSFVSTFWIRIYSNIRLRQDFYSNIFEYLFVSIFRTQTDLEDVFVDFLWILYFAYG